MAPIKEIKKVCVIGAGTMGLQIALVSAVHGYRVAVYDISAEALKKVPALYREHAHKLQLGDDSTEKLPVAKAMENITFTTDAAVAARDADITSESVTESVPVKKTVHAQFEKLCPPHCILTTNTSFQMVSDIEPALTHPEKFVAMHFHSGLAPLVDVMKGQHGNEKTIDTVTRFVRSLGLVPIVMKKESGGYLYNTMLGMWYMGGLISVARGVATPVEVDRAWMLVTGAGAGPFGSMDSVGLDVVYGCTNSENSASPFAIFSNVAPVIKPYIDRGELGVKTGKGFYTYPNPAFQQPGFLKGEK